MHPSNFLTSIYQWPADSVFLEDARSDRVVTYGELAATMAHWQHADIPPRVALTIADPVDFAITYISLIATGITVVPLDPKAPATENQRLMDQAEVVTVISSADARAFSSTDAMRSSNGAAMLFSSGSTGERKLIRLEESHLLHAADAIALHNGLHPRERGYNPLPLHHINAEVVGVLATLRSGATLVLDSAFHKTDFWKLMHQREVSWINAVPAIIAILANEPNHYDTSSIRFIRSASAPLSTNVLERFRIQHNIKVIETYGMTEAASQITANPLSGLQKPGSVGKPVGVELRVVDAGNRVISGVGTVQIRGASVVTSYVNGVAKERFTSDHWLDTGDQGYIDGDGYVFLVGRTDDVINNGGEKIFPREIEEVLLGDAGVSEVIVVPRVDDIKGQVPVAFITTDDAATVERLYTLCTAKLPKSMRPVEIIVLDELPRGVTGKLSRHQATALANR